MPKPPSPATERAIDLVRQGAAPYAAAIDCGIDPSTIYRALARVRKAREAARTRSSRKATR